MNSIWELSISKKTWPNAVGNKSSEFWGHTSRENIDATWSLMNVVSEIIQSGWRGVLTGMIIEKSRDLRAVWLRMERAKDQEGLLQFKMEKAKDQEELLQFKMERAKDQERECAQVSLAQSQILAEHFLVMSWRRCLIIPILELLNTIREGEGTKTPLT